MLALALLAGVSAEQILGSYIFQRHGDRLQKPTVYLTPVGTRQCQESGEFYASRYIGTIDGLDEIYDADQYIVSVPAADVLFKSLTAFSQGFYPAVNSTDKADVQGASMNDGSTETPAEDIQYVMLDAVDTASDNYWKVVGSANCPTYTAAQNTYYESQNFVGLNSSTADFYESLWQYVQGDFAKSKLNFENAYTVFDHFLASDVHNETFHNLIGGQDSDVFKQVRTLQDQYSKGLNVHSNNTDAQIAGKTILGQVGSFVSLATNASQPQRIQVFGGSYDQFYQVFSELGLFDVDDALYTGIVNYAASVAFEVYADDNNDQFVRVGIRNGTSITQTNVTLDFVPVFGSSNKYMSVSDFTSKVSSVGISSTSKWCDACSGSSATVCKLYTAEAATSTATTSKKNSLTLADAGGIGAGVTIFVFALLGLVAWLLMRRRSPRSLRSGTITSETNGSELKA